MTLRRYELLACALGACVVAANVAIKPGLVGPGRSNAGDILRRDREWRSRLAPNFELPLTDGSTFHLASSIGREVVILNFFTTWARGTDEELPEFQRYVSAQRAQGNPLRIIAINGQEPHDVVARFLRRIDVTLPVAFDDPGAVLRAYQVTAFPTTVVIGADGRVRLYEPRTITNADVAFDALVKPEFAAIARRARGGL